MYLFSPSKNNHFTMRHPESYEKNFKYHCFSISSLKIKNVCVWKITFTKIWFTHTKIYRFQVSWTVKLSPKKSSLSASLSSSFGPSKGSEWSSETKIGIGGISPKSGLSTLILHGDGGSLLLTEGLFLGEFSGVWPLEPLWPGGMVVIDCELTQRWQQLRRGSEVFAVKASAYARPFPQKRKLDRQLISLGLSKFLI